MANLEFGIDLDDGLYDFTLNEASETESSDTLAKKCEGLQTDNERRKFFRSIDKNSPQTFELYCPSILVLAKSATTEELKNELHEFLIKHLAYEKSRLVRKTCAYILKTFFLPAEDPHVQEYFILLSSLEEFQSHVVEPSLEKMSILSSQILSKDCPLKWEHLRVSFIIALKNQNGWIRTSTILRILKLPIELLEEDYEFLIDNFFGTLSQFDLYWRIEHFCSIDKFINDLRSFIEQFQTKDFYVKFLNYFASRNVPSPMFFISCSLPNMSNKLFNSQDFPLARRLFNAIDNVQLQKLRHNIFLNFFKFFVQVFDLKNTQDFIPLFELLPKKVKPLANQILLDTFSESIKYEGNENIEIKELDDDGVSQMIERIFNGEDLSLDNIQSLVKAIPKVNDERKDEIVNAMKAVFIESRKTPNAPTICVFYVRSLLNTFDLNPSEKLETLFNVLEMGINNPQIGYIISREINKESNVSTELYPLLLELSTYGELQNKLNEVTCLAHKKAKSFDLDEITDVDLLRIRTRELAIVKLITLCLQNKDLIGKFVLQLLQEFGNNDKKFKKRNFGLSAWHRKQTRLVLLLLTFIGNAELSSHLSKSDNEKIQHFCIEHVLDPNQQYSIKLAIEWILTLYCIRDEKFYAFFLEQSLSMGLKRIGAVSSWIMICLRSLRSSNKITHQRLMAFVIKLLPFVTTQHFLVRVFSLAAMKFICKWHREFVESDPAFRFAIEVADFDLEVSGNSRKIVGTICTDPFFEFLLPQNTDLTTVFYLIPKISGMPNDELIFESLPNDSSLKECGILNFTGDLSAFEKSSIFYSVGNNKISKPKIFDDEKARDEDFQIQQKIDTVEQEFIGKKKLEENKQLIVIASLLTKIPNIAGLCRTSEIFNVTELIVSTLSIVETKEFQSQSVSADLHLKISEVKNEFLIEYLKECREKGFSIVALEQASRSVTLEELKFPEKTVLLLGDEKRGIPADLIRFCDHLVEIPQLGIIRSLNVHVAGSLFIYKYAVQHLMD